MPARSIRSHMFQHARQLWIQWLAVMKTKSLDAPLHIGTKLKIGSLRTLLSGDIRPQRIPAQTHKHTRLTCRISTGASESCKWTSPPLLLPCGSPDPCSMWATNLEAAKPIPVEAVAQSRYYCVRFRAGTLVIGAALVLTDVQVNGDTLNCAFPFCADPRGIRYWITHQGPQTFL
jgi:hypothetical protein